MMIVSRLLLPSVDLGDPVRQLKKLLVRLFFSGLFDFSQRAYWIIIARGSSRRKPDSASSVELYF
jgi:hypothetical protein